jgi:hypothetical protein
MEQKINKRLIAHINDGYLQRLCLQKGADKAEKKAEIYNQVVDDIRKFVRGESEDNLLFTYDYISNDGQTRSTWWMEAIDCEEDDDVLTEQRAYNDYQERSKTAGDRAESLAWMMGALLFGQLVGGSKFAEFYVLGAAALLYLLLSAMQSVWQSVTIWLVKCRIKRTGITLNDYPDWVGFGAWVFYWLKMIIIAIGAIYGASHFISFAM